MKILKTANYKKMAQGFLGDGEPESVQSQQFSNEDMVPKDAWGGLSGIDFQKVIDLVNKGMSIKEAIYQVKPNFNAEKFDVVSKAVAITTQSRKF